MYVLNHHSQGEDPMDQVHSTTEHRKGKHLSFEERVVIQTRPKDGWTLNRIAGELGCAPNTVPPFVTKSNAVPSLFIGATSSVTRQNSGRPPTRRIVKLVAVTVIF